ncbi:TPA: WxL domain-containing protein [Enterococcus faecium]|nr:WxL domain-containing protein [Enterococcus faecium]EME8272167.1 WxL domain-containing protein [Enterococcus faecium]HAQ6572102.1 WxL domain-containing protein [Enterococcus faecium]HCC6683777.1 WxL domain-containing protein [Enterococcus faecium]
MKKTSLKCAGAIMLALTMSQAALPVLADETKEYKSNGVVEFVPDDSPTDPVDPLDPDPENPVFPWDPTTPDHNPQPGTKGPLSLDYASSIDFGKNKISTKDQTYYAEAQYLWNAAHTEKDESSARPNYVQVTDKRGNNAGWSLTVKQEGQLSNSNTLNKELTGATISFKEGVADTVMEGVTAPETFDFVLTPGQSMNVMNAKENAGMGTWVDRFGTLENMDIEGETVLKDPAITLDVPGKTPKDAVQYSTKLTWVLADTPLNQ